ncbi:AAA-domain-containing protein [Trichocladium antarcticum]|uniref:AAA-domain-containing protein n=1 Tax=Trichocladium antarcticum TaxID=1450529 RepID=A0AAN6UHQ0_9PEZI|nr:AAA-domain-containing protein [Trichocladium antarcticum]
MSTAEQERARKPAKNGGDQTALMLAAARARALLSATSAHRLPRVATARAASALGGALPHRRPHAAPSRPHEPAIATRHFTTSPIRGRPADPNADEPPAEPKKDDGAADNSSPPTETPAQPAVELKKEKLRIQGYGSARARAARNRAEELPAVELPAWFIDDHVSLYESRPIGTPGTLLSPLEEADLEKALEAIESNIRRFALTEGELESWKDRLLRFRAGAEDAAGFEKLVGRFRGLHHVAWLQALALVHRHDADPAHVERLRQHHASLPAEDDRRVPWWPSLPADAERWLCNLRSDSAPGSEGLHASPLATRPDPEYPVCTELLFAVRSQIELSPAASRQESQRPVTVLSVLNRKGRSVAESVMNDIATDLKADVVHLDAYTIASLVGNHLGQNQYSARGNLSMLGYSAAELNGRLAPRPDLDAESEMGLVAVALPSRLRSFLTSKDSLLSGAADGRWEDMKMGAALDAIIASADIKRGMARPGPTSPPEDLIIHLHDYVELNSLNPAIVSRLRVLVDRLWMSGRRAVLVGSSSGDMSRSSQWRDQLIEIGREGGHVIPFHASETSQWMESHDNFYDNLNNIEAMLRAMVGDHVHISYREQFRVQEGRILVDSRLDGKYDALVETLSSHLFDAQWVYRVASLLVGVRSPRLSKFGLPSLRYVLKFMSDRNSRWSAIQPGVRPPYFSPLFAAQSANSPFSPSAPEEWPMSSSPANNLSGGAASTEYNRHEKSLLSGLINAKDIHTTFNDIVVPQETKDSLTSLTSLSLLRPEAFSYGVLKTERIQGCLLYGPPGTGKTLLAKAIAKESGANMLEVSAASINSMWRGQSEKNVRALFSLARKLAPAVIFLDEADSLLGARSSGGGGGGGSGRGSGHRETITQFLREWDGLSDMRAFIMVATNRPFDLDEAVLRRLPRKILVDLPLRPERARILAVMLRDEARAPDVDLAALAAETDLYSGSDLKNLCVAAAMEAVREEMRARDAWQGDEGEYVFPARRVLTRAHFAKGLAEISASISEDMESLKAIRKFDGQYGDAGRKRKGKRSMGFEVVPERVGTAEARVRQVEEAGM